MPSFKIERAPAPQAEPADTAAIDRIECALAERDAQIAELQQAIVELANTGEALSAPVTVLSDQAAFADLAGRMAALESRLIEQDRTIRHTLTMLIEWIEADDAHRAAA